MKHYRVRFAGIAGKNGLDHLALLFLRAEKPAGGSNCARRNGDSTILTSIAAVGLNAFFNRTTTEQAEADTFLAAQAAEHI